MGLLDAFRKVEEVKIEEVNKSSEVESNNSTINNEKVVSLPAEVNPSLEEANLNPTSEETTLIEIEVDEERTLANPDLPLSKDEIKAKAEEFSLKPQDQKKAELDFYKFYANGVDSSINSLILKYGNDVESLLDELEVRIIQYQKDQAVFRIYEQHTRLRRSLIINEKLSKDKEKRRKKDLEYVQFVPGEGLVKAKKVRRKVVTKGLDTKERLIQDLVAKGMSLEQAKALLG